MEQIGIDAEAPVSRYSQTGLVLTGHVAPAVKELNPPAVRTHVPLAGRVIDDGPIAIRTREFDPLR